MDKVLLDESLLELRRQVEAAAAKLREYRKREKSLEEKRDRIEERLAAVIKRIGEFSGGK